MHLSVYLVYCYRDITSYLSKITNFDLPHLHLAPRYGVTTDQCSAHLKFVEIFGMGYRVAY